MNTLGFIASVIASLTWPLTLLIVIAIIIRNGRKLAIFVKTIRFRDIELTFRDDFDKARDIADGLQAASVLQIQSTFDVDPENVVLQLAKIDPGVAILRSWQKLEAKLVQVIQHNGLIRFTNPEKFVRRLLELEKITSQEAELCRRLRSIRNAAVHANELQRTITVAEAVEYDQLVKSMVQRLDHIRNEPGYIKPE